MRGGGMEDVNLCGTGHARRAQLCPTRWCFKNRNAERWRLPGFTTTNA